MPPMTTRPNFHGKQGKKGPPAPTSFCSTSQGGREVVARVTHPASPDRQGGTAEEDVFNEPRVQREAALSGTACGHLHKVSLPHESRNCRAACRMGVEYTDPPGPRGVRLQAFRTHTPRDEDAATEHTQRQGCGDTLQAFDVCYCYLLLRSRGNRRGGAQRLAQVPRLASVQSGRNPRAR